MKSIISKQRHGNSSKKKAEKKSKNSKEKNDPPSYQIFESPLDYAVASSMYPDRVPIPRIVRDCILYVEKYGLTSQGVYRLSGTSSKIERLKQMYDTELTVDLEQEDTDVNVVACLLKLYFRKLPHCLINEILFPEFEQVLSSKGNDMSLILNSFEEILNRLPSCNRITLGWLCVHLHNLLEHSDETLMSEQNIIIVFVPCLRIQPTLFLILLKFATRLFPDCSIKGYDLQSEVKDFKECENIYIDDIERHIRFKEDTVERLQSNISQFSKYPKVVDHLCSALWETQRQLTELKRSLKLCKNKGNTNIPKVDCLEKNTEIVGVADDVDEILHKAAAIDVSTIDECNRDGSHSSHLNEASNDGIVVSTQSSDFSDDNLVDDLNTPDEHKLEPLQVLGNIGDSENFPYDSTMNDSVMTKCEISEDATEEGETTIVTEKNTSPPSSPTE